MTFKHHYWILGILGIYSEFYINHKPEIYQYLVEGESMLTIKYFTLGAIGSLLSAICIGLIFIVDLFFPIYPIFTISYGPYILYTLIEFILILLVGVGILLASFGYREIKNNFSLLSGAAGFIFGIITSVLVISIAIAGLITPEYVILIYPPPLIYQINSIVRLFTALFFGLTHIIWGIVHFSIRKFCKKQNLSLITSGLFIVSGVAILSIFYSNIGLMFSIVSLLFASIVFWTFGLKIS